MRILALSLCIVMLPCSLAFAECKQFIELWSAEESGSGSYVNLWSNPTESGKFPKAGALRPGSRALIIATSAQDFKVKSPLDGSVGWVNKMQVKRMLMQDDKTYKPCR